MQAPRVSVLVALLTASLAPSLAQLQLAGPCPNVSDVSNFNLSMFMGTWFEQIHTKRWSDVELDCSCHYFEMNSAYNFSYSTYSRNPNLKTLYYKGGDVTLRPLPSDSTRFELDVTESGETNTVHVLDTDYTSYVTLWTCLPADNSHYENVVVLTRDKFPGLSALLSALDALDANKLPRMYLVYTEQRNCPDFNITHSNSTQRPMSTYPYVMPTTNITVMYGSTVPTDSTMPYTVKSTQSTTGYDQTSDSTINSTLLTESNLTTMWKTDPQYTMPSTDNTSQMTSSPNTDMTMSSNAFTMPNNISITPQQSSSSPAVLTTMPVVQTTMHKSTVLSNSTTGTPASTMKPSASSIVTSSSTVTVVIYAVLCFISF